MAKKPEKKAKEKEKIKRKSLKETPKKGDGDKKTKKEKKEKHVNKGKESRKRAKKKDKDNGSVDNYENSQMDEDNFEEWILPGQKYATPPAGDATRAFYESLLEQRPDSLMAKKYCVEYGCWGQDKAKEFIALWEKNKKKKK